MPLVLWFTRRGVYQLTLMRASEAYNSQNNFGEQ